jgi:hypothetical protein
MGEHHEPNATMMAGHDAKCPRCGIIHRAWIYWTGNGMPRKYCNLCQQHVTAFGRHQTEYSVSTPRGGRPKE